MSDPPSATDPPVTKRSKWFWLRIATSVFFALLTLALCALWVRSYRTPDILRITPNPTRHIHADSIWGRLDFVTYTTPFACDVEWRYLQFDSEEGWDKVWNEPTGEARFGFILKLGLDDLHIVVPHWFAVSLSLMLAIAPWVTAQFSLRTLLIATTLVAVVLGLMVWAGR